MQQFLSVVLFYKPFFLWSLALNFALIVLGTPLWPFVGAKLMLILFLWYLTLETSAKRKLSLYNNLGISTPKLFSICFIIDALISLPIYIMLQEFV